MYTNLLHKKVSFYTLGCKVNQYESDAMAESLKQSGCIISDFNQPFDICIINTCSVTNMAERKSRQIFHKAKKNNPTALIVVVGCYVQADREGLSKDINIDLIIGNNCKKDLAKIISEHYDNILIESNFIDINNTDEYEEMNLVMPTDHTRAYVKVQDGCNNFCSYCIIPYTRGRIRSRELKNVMHEISVLASNGIKEIVLTGIHLSSYKIVVTDGDLTYEQGLLYLIQQISTIDGIERIRLGSLEPRIITDDFLLGVSKISKLCPHFHLSLQSACNDTLIRMNRKYTIEEYILKCQLIRKYYDNPAITTDVIVGFPGETTKEFETTYANLKELNLYEMHIFKYSIRKGTVAATMPNQVDDSTKEKRSNILLELSAYNKRKYEDLFINKNVNVLIERIVEENNIYYIKGHTDKYLSIKHPINTYDQSLINTIIPVLYTNNN